MHTFDDELRIAKRSHAGMWRRSFAFIHRPGRLAPRGILGEKFLKYCVVGGSGAVIDMAALYLLAHPKGLGLNVSLSKGLSAEIAMLTNFVLNNMWTFRGAASSPGSIPPVIRRMAKFHGICGTGIVLAITIVTVLHNSIGLTLGASNLFAIGTVTIWNFWMNAKFNWAVGPEHPAARK